VTPPETHRVSAAGAVFPVIEAGDGPSVVFLHGALGDRRSFAPALAALGPGLRAVAYDQRGFGRGPWPAEGPAFGVAAHAADLLALIDALGAAPAHLVAWSYGGHVALAAAHARPEAVASLMLFEPGTPSYLDKAAMDAWTADARGAYGPAFKAAAAGDHDAAARALIEAVGGACAFDALPEERRARALENAESVARIAGQTPPPALSPADLAAIGRPALVAWGSETRPAFRLVAEAAAAALGAETREIAGAGHLWPEDDPEGFAALLRDWALRCAA
jgi:pimeloyl-ACP methyl ester carboxylesterase